MRGVFVNLYNERVRLLFGVTICQRKTIWTDSFESKIGQSHSIKNIFDNTQNYVHSHDYSMYDYWHEVNKPITDQKECQKSQGHFWQNQIVKPPPLHYFSLKQKEKVMKYLNLRKKL